MNISDVVAEALLAGRADAIIAADRDGIIRFWNPGAERLWKAATARSISAELPRLTGVTSTPTEGATDWMTANWPMSATMAGSRRTAARVTPGVSSRPKQTFGPEDCCCGLLLRKMTVAHSAGRKSLL